MQKKNNKNYRKHDLARLLCVVIVFVFVASYVVFNGGKVQKATENILLAELKHLQLIRTHTHKRFIVNRNESLQNAKMLHSPK